MKSKSWALLLAAIVLSSAGLSVWLLRPKTDAHWVRIWSEGQLVDTVDLHIDRVLTVEGKNGTNIITVRDGKIAVTEADCPDHYCMDRGFCSGGVQIVCLPNRLVIQFAGESETDGVAG